MPAAAHWGVRKENEKNTIHIVCFIDSPGVDSAIRLQFLGGSQVQPVITEYE